MAGVCESPFAGWQRASSLCPHMAESPRAPVSASSHGGINPTMGVPPARPHLNAITSKRLPLQIPPHWEIKLQHTDLGGHKLLRSRCPHSCHQALYQWSPWGGHSSLGSAQEACGHFLVVTGTGGGDIGTKYGGAGTLGSPAQPKITPSLQAAVILPGTCMGQKSLIFIHAYNLTASHKTQKHSASFCTPTLLKM